MYGINEVLEGLIRDDYSEHLSEQAFEIDCSLGENPYGIYPEIKLDEHMLHSIGTYPHDEDDVKKEIVKRYSKIKDLKISNVALTCGSMGGLICLNRVFMKKDKNVIGPAPQFTAIVDDFNVYQANYIPVKMKKENNYKFDLNDFLEVVKKEKDAYIYIDNPNNPTGQIIDIADIEKIIQVAKEVNSFVCVDEAYGDYMDDKNSGINLIDKYDNMVVFRTLSKGTGGAGIRMGYLLASEKFISIFNKFNIPFATTGFANYVGAKIVNSGWEKFAIEKSLVNKKELIDSLKNIKVSHTAMEVPIAMYYVEEDVNLEQVMIDNGLRVVTCEGYHNVSHNAVRINLHKDFAKMKELMLKIDAKFDK